MVYTKNFKEKYVKVKIFLVYLCYLCTTKQTPIWHNCIIILGKYVTLMYTITRTQSQYNDQKGAFIGIMNVPLE